ncbi:hypothetical protein [Streptomyces sp. NPDC054838]
MAALAPEELPLVDGLRHFDDATVVRRLSRGGGRREPLGFGIGEVAALIAPVVWLVLDGVAQQMAVRAEERASRSVTSMVRRLLRRPAPVAEVPALTREQLADVRARVLAVAGQRGLPPGRAEEIADAVVARLILSDGPEAPAVLAPTPATTPDGPHPTAPTVPAPPPPPDPVPADRPEPAAGPA